MISRPALLALQLNAESQFHANDSVSSTVSEIRLFLRVQALCVSARYVQQLALHGC